MRLYASSRVPALLFLKLPLMEMHEIVLHSPCPHSLLLILVRTPLLVSLLSHVLSFIGLLQHSRLFPFLTLLHTHRCKPSRRIVFLAIEPQTPYFLRSPFVTCISLTCGCGCGIATSGATPVPTSSLATPGCCILRWSGRSFSKVNAVLVPSQNFSLSDHACAVRHTSPSDEKNAAPLWRCTVLSMFEHRHQVPVLILCSYSS